MPYREDEHALEARRAELEEAIATLRARARDVPYLEVKIKELERELAGLRALETGGADKSRRVLWMMGGAAATLCIALGLIAWMAWKSPDSTNDASSFFPTSPRNPASANGWENQIWFPIDPNEVTAKTIDVPTGVAFHIEIQDGESMSGTHALGWVPPPPRPSWTLANRSALGDALRGTTPSSYPAFGWSANSTGDMHGDVELIFESESLQPGGPKRQLRVTVRFS